MYRLLLVDDEAWVLRSLMESVDWAGNGFALLGTATDGAEALEFMERSIPDLVVTDIRMPVMGGLDLIGHALRRWPQMRFIILSGHAEFDYAKRALESGVAGYCLKPVQSEEMSACLHRVRAELEQETLHRLDAWLTMEETLDVEAAETMLERLGIPWDGVEGMRVTAGPCQIGYPLLRAEELSIVRESQVAGIVASFTGENNIGCSANFRTANLLCHAVAEAREARDSVFLDGCSGVRFHHAGSRITLHRQFQALSQAMSSCDATGIRLALAGMEQALLEGEAGLRQVEFCRLRLEAFLETESMEDLEANQAESDFGSSLTEAYSTMHAMFIAFGDLLVRNCAADPSAADGSGDEIGPLLMQYIVAHVTERISLMDLSERFHFSPGYLCRLIKRETGKTLTDHQSSLRLEMAANLLGASDLAVAEIAKRCGYQDYFFFARIFRKTFGMTPSAYRSRL